MKLEKTKGFTLSEVLITIVIIGIVAVISIQLIYAAYQKKVMEAGFKKNFSVISQIAETIPSQTGNCSSGNSEEIKKIIIDKMSKMKEASNNATIFPDYVQYTYTGMESNPTLQQNCLIGNSNWSESWGGTPYKAVLTDGAYFGVCSHLITGDSFHSMDGVFISVDVNGGKKPNKFGYDIWNFHLNGRTCKPEAASTYRNYKKNESGYGQSPYNVSTKSSCSKLLTTDDSNGFYCSQYAMKNVCPDDETKTYWECL